ncbi:MAG: SDR family oxidoreductase [Dehalococcoidia bacterium]|nr:SDR family oxidoreductase [Dehalococcoidia bacterium]MYD29601.1 SDR family oxidoreductase [Dehalococcoidia bacterium]
MSASQTACVGAATGRLRRMTRCGSKRRARASRTGGSPEEPLRNICGLAIMRPSYDRARGGSMPRSLEGQSAIVTGAALGLGNAFARALAGEGANVTVCDVREEVNDLVQALEASGVQAQAFVADVGVVEDVRRVVDGHVDRFGGVDVLVSNAGVWRASTATDDLDKTLDDYDFVVNTNLKGVYLFGRAVIPHMVAGGGGNIVHISSDHIATCGTPYRRGCDEAPDCVWRDQGPRPTGGGPDMDLYDASKWGINGFTIPWSKALREQNVRVNGLCMGATDSHMVRTFHEQNPDSGILVNAMRAEDVAALMVDLINEGPDGRTGNNINIAVGHPIELPPPGSLYIYSEATA